MNTNTFRKSVTALAVTATLGFPAFVAAQDSGANDVERIQVTGSRIKRTDMETASPVSVFDAEAIEASGFTTMEKFIHNLPSMNGAMNGSNVNNGSGGSASANLRGLGSARTLILINGRRYASGDLNAIPMAMVKRVEVLRDGASTIYGSDAIAGVINFITKTDFEGAEFSAQYDLTGEGDGETTKLSGVIGTSSGKGSVVLGLEYQNRNSIGQADRGFSRIPLDEKNGQIVSGGSDRTSYGLFSPKGENEDYVLDPDTGNVRLYDGQKDAYNFASASYLKSPQELFTINAVANYDISRDLRVFLEGGYANRQSNQLLAPTATFWGAPVDADFEHNPIDKDLSVYRRLTESGGRELTQDFSDYRMVLGFEGYLDNGWSWDISYNYARYVDTTAEYNQANRTRFNTLLDEKLCSNDEECPGIWNPFKENSLSDEMMDYALITNSPVERGTTKQFMANLTGDTGSWSLPAGSIAWAAGVEKRWESYEYQPDGAASIGQIYNVSGIPSEGSYDVEEAYIEADIPLLRDLPGVQSLDLSAAVRRSDYNFLDAQTTTKFGLEYVPKDGLLVRATIAEGFRAPTIDNLNSPQVISFSNYADPCIEYENSNNQTVRDNCSSEGIEEGFNLTNDQSATILSGNEELEPETSDSFTFGVVYQPEFMDNLNVAIDYYDIEIENGIGAPNVSFIVNQCYTSENFSSSSCDLILGPDAVDTAGWTGSDYRDEQGYIAGVDATTQNISTFETSGIDFDVNWNDEVAGGLLSLRLDGTYLKDYNYQVQEGTAPLELAGKFGADANFAGRIAAFSKWRTNFTASYKVDDVAVSWTSRFQSGVDDINFDSSDVSSSVGSYFYHDMQASYFLNSETTFTLGIRNLFDKQPPYVSNNADMNTLNTSYDTAGQYWYARVGFRF